MGLIRKKTLTRGTEGGLKYICDVCSADITSEVLSVRNSQFA
jgi:transcriptional adapter 2-alpha